MTPQAYKEALATLGLSQAAAARLFWVNPRTGRRWASGEQPVPRAVEIAIRLMIHYKVDPKILL